MSSRSTLSTVLAVTALAATSLGLATGLVAPGSASADVVMSPPDNCPSGEVGITSHGGPRCVAVAPTDCPVGWVGQLGGTCALTPCAVDSTCGPGKACVEHSVCLQPMEDGFYDYGEEEREQHGSLEPVGGSLFRSPGLLAGPMAPKKPRSKPIFRYNAVNLCSADVACAAPGTCQSEKLCVPSGQRALAYRGSNTQPARVARKTDTPLTASAAQPTETTSTAPPAGTTTARGCGGCAAAPVTPARPWALGAMVLLGIAVARRRRKVG